MSYVYLNRIAEEIDAKNPKNIKNKSGMAKENELFYEILSAKFVDAFCKFNDEGDNFTWWPNRKGFREEKKGYRFDYFLVSKSFEKTLTDLHYQRPNGFRSCTCSIRIEFLSSMQYSK